MARSEVVFPVVGRRTGADVAVEPDAEVHVLDRFDPNILDGIVDRHEVVKVVVHPLVTALEEGCTVVAAHAGMSAFFDDEDFFPQLLELVRRYPNLYCDTAILADKFRWRNLPLLLETHRFHRSLRPL